MLKYVWDGTVSLWAILIIGSFLVLVTALGFLSTRAYDRATEDYQTSQAYTETQREFQRRCAGLEGEEIFDCLEKQIEAAREPGRSEEDVQAQKEMARWALWMIVVTGIVGFGTIAATMVGVYWVRETLTETRKAVKAARDAVDETRRIGEAQTRAYVGVVGVSILFTSGEWKPNVRVKYMNTGQTPAYKLRNVLNHEITLIGTPTFKNRKSKTTDRGFDLGPGQDMTSTDMISQNKWNSLRDGLAAGRYKLFVFGEITYEDAFGHPRYTRYRFRLDVDDDGLKDGENFGICREGNESS